MAQIPDQAEAIDLLEELDCFPGELSTKTVNLIESLLEQCHDARPFTQEQRRLIHRLWTQWIG